jgi:exodeoxyribonuclease VII small subunit
MTRKSETEAAAATTSEALSETFGFTAAMTELEAILRRVEAEDVDLDQLATELARAAELLELCRGKLRRAEAEVGQVLQQLEVSDGE